MTKHLNHRQCKHLQLCSSNCFALQLKVFLSNFVHILYPESFMLCSEAVHKLSLHLYTSSDFKLRP